MIGLQVDHEIHYVYVEMKEGSFVKKFNNFHDAITYTSRFTEMDPEANVTILIPFE